MTLKLNELRIGNWIQFQNEEPQQLTAYTLASLCQNPVALEFYKPINIAEAWLFKFGFESIGELHPTFKKGIYLIEEGLLRNGEYFIRQIINKEDSICLTLNGFRFVHELQNTIFSLTKKEAKLFCVLTGCSEIQHCLKSKYNESDKTRFTRCELTHQEL